MPSSAILCSPFVQLDILTQEHTNSINSLSFSTNGQYLASGGDDSVLMLWNALHGKLLYRLMLDAPIDAIIWHPIHSETLVIGLSNGGLHQLHGMTFVGSLVSKVTIN